MLRGLGLFLLTRGLWLILVQRLVVARAWSFAPSGIEQIDGQMEVVLQVIRAIGASMVLLSGAQFLGQPACLAIGAMLVTGHILLDPIWPVTTGIFDDSPAIWVALHAQMPGRRGAVRRFLGVSAAAVVRRDAAGVRQCRSLPRAGADT